MSEDENYLNDVLKQLKSGAILIKQKFNGKRFSRRFFLHERGEFISYDRSRKIFGKPRSYHVKDIDEIRSGYHAHTFDRLLKRGVLKSKDETRVFSILYDNHRKEEHLIASDAATRDLWIEGLQYLMQQYTRKSIGQLIREEEWILNFFYAADRNHSNSLSKNECQYLLAHSLNITLPEHTFEQMFRKIDKSRDGALNSKEFVEFFHLLTRRKDLYEIMQRYTKNESMEKICMNKSELASFLIDKPADVQDLINEFEMNSDLRENGFLSLDGFRNMLLSKQFNIINAFSAHEVYHDMTRPLCDYYINTSHNTYLFYSQLTGDSNPEAYNQVLLMGCRAVELDCYDGDDGPIVTHAHTLVKHCTFESIIQAIEPNLFKVSPYPVILNIENHCSDEQQKQMARILKTILGDRLLTKPLPNRDPSILPSPDDLKYKVLIRSKKITTAKKPHGDDDDHRLNPVSKDIEPELAELFIYLQNIPYRDYDYAKTHYSCFHSSSLEEGHFIKFAQRDPIGLLRQTTWRLLRLYPDAFRQDSSNLNPVQAWNFGIQLAALNYQNSDDMMALCLGKFLDNGGCGYILKPNYLLNAENIEFNPWDCSIDFDYPRTLTITVISGQFLPRSNHKTSDIPDPFIKISTHGMRCDEQTYQTQVVKDNGFDPIWNETFQFRIRFPQLCLLYFSVMDHDVLLSNERMAYFCAPVTMIQRGFRHIRLRANNNDASYSTLFVYVEIQCDNETDDSDESVTCTRL